MALSKSIKQDNGIPLSYHRILFVHSAINTHISIAVISYVDEESRENENAGKLAYTATVTYELPYKENMTIEEAYDYLKTLPAFADAINC